MLCRKKGKARFPCPRLSMSRLQLLLRSVLHLVKAKESRIAVFTPERVQKDKSQQWLPRDPVRASYRIVASTFWAIWHHW